MKIFTTPGFGDYELLDSGEGRRLERFGKYVLNRPDPEVLWNKKLSLESWQNADAAYLKNGENGKWQIKDNMPEKWQMAYKDIKFWAKMSPFKHTGVFPEQAGEWELIEETIKSAGHEVNVLNLFAYTGISTIIAAKAGAKVTHVDASRPAVTWANENRDLNNLEDAPVRWIIDDALKFTNREIKRGVKYDIILMDPPAYGHGPTGEPWDFNRNFNELVKNCCELLSDDPQLFLVNSYATSISSISIENVLKDSFKEKGNIEFGELAIQQKNSDRLLSTGKFAYWKK